MRLDRSDRCVHSREFWPAPADTSKNERRTAYRLLQSFPPDRVEPYKALSACLVSRAEEYCGQRRMARNPQALLKIDYRQNVRVSIICLIEAALHRAVSRRSFPRGAGAESRNRATAYDLPPNYNQYTTLFLTSPKYLWTPPQPLTISITNAIVLVRAATFLTQSYHQLAQRHTKCFRRVVTRVQRLTWLRNAGLNRNTSSDKTVIVLSCDYRHSGAVL